MSTDKKTTGGKTQDTTKKSSGQTGSSKSTGTSKTAGKTGTGTKGTK